MLPGRNTLISCAALLLAALPLVVAQGHDAEPAMKMGGAHSGQSGMNSAHHMINATTPAAHEEFPPNYFRHPEFATWMYAHIALMVLAWVFVLPTAVFLSAARSRLAIPVHFAFLLVNGLGIFTSIVYDARTPDLYPNNAHHKLGWAVTWIAVVWTLLGLINFYNARYRKPALSSPSHPMTSDVIAEYQRLHEYAIGQNHRWSGDSGQGTERHSASLCSGSRSPSSDDFRQKEEEQQRLADSDHEHTDDYEHVDSQQRGFLNGYPVDRFLSRKVPQLSAGSAANVIKFVYVLLERFQLPLGFIALTTGVVTWSGLFMSREIFNGLAHWIKGGIFVWYGLLTLGRWMGAFSDFGWAWNVRPQSRLVSHFAAKVPSAEFVESFVIFFYGASNVFLEHLNAWGKAWSAQDLEHISITIMFFGGGLLGMLIESQTMRDLLNTNVLLKKEDSAAIGGLAESQAQDWETPKTYRTSLNPMPGLVILLLGIMMSSHHQSSMVSTMLHSQWGSLFVGFAMARAVTYLLLYLSPPSSHFPSRPPSELVAAFCLISGGLIFMGSAKDVVRTLEANDLDAMFIFTVMIGLTALTMAWTTVLYAIKGWASRRQVKRSVVPMHA